MAACNGPHTLSEDGHSLEKDNGKGQDFLSSRELLQLSAGGMLPSFSTASSSGSLHLLDNEEVTLATIHAGPKLGVPLAESEDLTDKSQDLNDESKKKNKFKESMYSSMTDGSVSQSSGLSRPPLLRTERLLHDPGGLTSNFNGAQGTMGSQSNIDEDSNYGRSVQDTEEESTPKPSPHKTTKSNNAKIGSLELSKSDSVDVHVSTTTVDACDVNEIRTFQPSPTPPLGVEHLTDVNGNGTAKCRRWLEMRMETLEELESLGHDLELWEAEAEDFALIDQKLSASSEETENEEHDLLDFAENYYNIHLANPGYTGAISKTVSIVRRKSLTEVIATQDLLRYTKNPTLNSSLVQLHNQELTITACAIFKDLCKFMRGDIKEDTSLLLIRSVIRHGINSLELQDEIYCQLMRQVTENPHRDQCHRMWSVWSVCAVSFSPSRTLRKYLLSFLHAAAKSTDQVIAKNALFCLQHLANANRPSRRLPPSFTEIESILKQQALLCRVHFLDGKTKAISVEGTQTTLETLKILQEKIGLKDLHGWALYESTPEHDRYIHENEFIADIISDWEDKLDAQYIAQMPQPKNKKFSLRKQRGQSHVGSPKRVPPRTPLAEYGKLIFCRRVFGPYEDMPSDSVAVHLLYAQAVHHNVQIDEYISPTCLAVQLAGLQAQVIHGEFDVNKMYRYDDVDEYLCQRVITSTTNTNWSSEIAAAHKKYGESKTELEAKQRYLLLISQFSLYGCVKFYAHYKGYWHYGVEFILAVTPTAIKLISIQEKKVASEYSYEEIESFHVDFECELLKMQVRNQPSSKQTCYLFETADIDDLAKLLEEYAPHLTSWSTQINPHPLSRRLELLANDWIRLHDSILEHRKLLLSSGVMNRAQGCGSGLLKSALKKLSSRAAGSDKGPSSGSLVEEDMDIRGPYWSFSRVPFKHSLIAFESHVLEDVAVRMFNSTLVYTGLESVGDLKDADLITVVQTLMIKCMGSEDLCNEFYLQLIRQTTDVPSDVSRKTAERYWHLMTMATCTMLPSNHLVLRYLNLHLHRYALHYRQTEEGKYAYFCIKSLFRTCANRGRDHPPSNKEIQYVTKREALQTNLHLPSGQQMNMTFDSATTGTEALERIKAKVGMRSDARGWAIYQESKDNMWYVKPEEKLADVLWEWEKLSVKGSSVKEPCFVFKKRLFVEPFLNPFDPVEIDTLYHQSVTDLFEEKIRLTKEDAIHLCALRAQTEFGDYGYANNYDYTSVMRILPRHQRELIQVSELVSVHKRLVATSVLAANITFLEVLKHWPFYGASFFELTQTYMESWPSEVWLLVTQMGVHVIKCWGQTVYATYTFDSITETTHTMKNLILTIGQIPYEKTLVFNTLQAKEITRLIGDYKTEVLSHTPTTTAHLNLAHNPIKAKRAQSLKRQTAHIGNDVR